MGSRYGGLKQMDAVGMSGESIMDFSVYDAMRAGFGKVVFVIRADFEAEFRRIYDGRFGSGIKVDYVLQSIDKVPSGCAYNKERTKPWGTNHAILMADGVINEPFAAINADDFYGRDSYVVLARFLQSVEGKGGNYAMVAYRLGNTLSKYGAVTRGVCVPDSSGCLSAVEEHSGIEQRGSDVFAYNGAGKEVTFPLSTPVSMNMWGFTPDYFRYSEEFFRKFLQEHGNELKSEFFIPLMVDQLIRTGAASVKMLNTTAPWFGMTYQEDKPAVMQEIRDLIAAGEYPERLWEQ